MEKKFKQLHHEDLSANVLESATISRTPMMHLEKAAQSLPLFLLLSRTMTAAGAAGPPRAARISGSADEKSRYLTPRSKRGTRPTSTQSAEKELKYKSKWGEGGGVREGDDIALPS